MRKFDKNNITDEQLRASFTDFEVPFNETHWSKMQQNLDSLDADAEAIDDLVRQKMQNLEAKTDTPDWSRMAAALDDLEKEDTLFDRQIADRVERMEASYKNAHWEMMQKRLDETFTFRGKIVKYKVVELSLLLLAFLTVYNVSRQDFDLFKANKENDFVQKNISFELPQNVLNTEGVGQPKAKGNSDEISGIKTDNNYSKKENANIVNNKINELQGVDNQIVASDFQSRNSNDQTLFKSKDNVSSEQSTAFSNALVSATNLENSVKNDFNKNTRLAVDFLEVKNTLVQLENKKSLPNLLIEKNAENTEGGAKKIESVTFLNTLRTNTLSITGLYEQPNIKPLKLKNRWWQLGIFGTWGKNQTYSSYTYRNVDSTASDVRDIDGSGFSIGKRVGKIEVSSGVLYTRHQYRPPQIELITGSVVDNNLESYKTPINIRLSVVTVPLNVGFYVLDKGRFSIYAQVGGAFNMQQNLEAERTKPTTVDSRSQNASTDELIIPTYLNNSESQFSIKYLLKNQDNYFTTIQLGLGGEFKMNPYWSVFAQPTVYGHFGKAGIGSLDDRINNFSIHFGLKRKIGRIVF